MMNRDMMQGRWTEMRGQIREGWGMLTHSDTQKIQGKRIQLAGKMQQRYGWTKGMTDRQVHQFVTWVSKSWPIKR
jgi:uncharacterized protein YjbJ (UPF0337 family)